MKDRDLLRPISTRVAIAQSAPLAPPGAMRPLPDLPPGRSAPMAEAPLRKPLIVNPLTDPREAWRRAQHQVLDTPSTLAGIRRGPTLRQAGMYIAEQAFNRFGKQPNDIEAAYHRERRVAVRNTQRAFGMGSLAGTPRLRAAQRRFR